MKKNILAMLVASVATLFAVSAEAQSQFHKGDFALNLNYGIGAFTSNDWSGLDNVAQHSVGVMGEYGIMNVINERGTISVGGQLGMGFGSKDNVDFRRVRIATRGTLHYSFIPQIDTYAGCTFAFVDINKAKWEGSASYSENGVTIKIDSDSETEVKFIEPRLFAGARYMFSDAFGVNLETSWDRFAFVSLGFSFKF